MRRVLLAAMCVASVMRAATCQVELDRGKRTVIVQRVGTLLERHYVFRDRVDACRKWLAERQAQGAYSKLIAPVEFADALTSDLRGVCNDLHIRVKLKRGVAGRTSSRHRHRPRGDLAMNRHGFAKVQILRENIGYIRLRWFARAEQGGKTAHEAMKKVADVDALVIDVRDNTGGSMTMVTLLSSYFFTKPTNLLDTYWRSRNRTEPCMTKAPPHKGLVNVPVLFIVDRHSISAAEMLAYCLQQHDRAVVIGEVTAGAANATSDFSVDKRFDISIPTGAGRHPKTGVDWERTGVTPDHPVLRRKALPAALAMARAVAKERRKRAGVRR